MKKTFIFMTLIACIGLSACTINIGDKNSGNEKRKEKEKEKKEIKRDHNYDQFVIDNSSNQRSTIGILAKVYVDAIGSYSVAFGKAKPEPILPEELKSYLTKLHASDSTLAVVLYADEDAAYGQVRYVIRVAQELKMNLILGDNIVKEPEEEFNESPAPSIEQPKEQERSAEPVMSEEEVLAISQQLIADSIAEAQEKARKKAADMVGGLSFADFAEDPSDCDGVSGMMAHGQGRCDKDLGYDLLGRNVIGKIPQPSNDFNEEGRIIVQIRVNPEGKVVEALHIGGTISDSRTIRNALDAAKKARFSQSKNNYDQIGTITYQFKFH